MSSNLILSYLLMTGYYAFIHSLTVSFAAISCLLLWWLTTWHRCLASIYEIFFKINYIYETFILLFPVFRSLMGLTLHYFYLLISFYTLFLQNHWIELGLLNQEITNLMYCPEILDSAVWRNLPTNPATIILINHSVSWFLVFIFMFAAWGRSKSMKMLMFNFIHVYIYASLAHFMVNAITKAGNGPGSNLFAFFGFKNQADSIVMSDDIF